MLYVPPWIAHGFRMITDHAEVLYKTTEEYRPSAELGILWIDPKLGIEGPLENLIVSPKDSSWPRLLEAHHVFTCDDGT